MSTTLIQPPDLRPYQVELIEQVQLAWGEGHRRVLLQLPTGAGKTIIFANLAGLFTSWGKRVLVLAHRQELLLQAQEKLETATGLPVGIIKAGYRSDPSYLIQVASVQTLSRRSQLPQADLVIVDECHHVAAQSYTKILNRYPEALILGVSATPLRNDGRGFKQQFDTLITGPSVQDLTDDGYLVPYKLLASQHQVKTRGVRTTAGEFNSKDLADAVDDCIVAGDLIESYRQHANGLRTVVFAVDVAHSKDYAAEFQAAGIAAEHLDGQTPSEERRAILDRFLVGYVKVLTNCGIVAEGLDIPGIEAIQCVRPTKSLSLWLQMVGRALRPSPGKPHAVLIDHTHNWFVHDLPNTDRQWSLEPVSLKNKRWALSCPQCRHVFKPFLHELRQKQATCPNCEVEMEFEAGKGNGDPPPTRVIVQDASLSLSQVDPVTSAAVLNLLPNLFEKQQQYGYQRGWIYHRWVEDCRGKRLKLGLLELQEFAKQAGYQPGWAWYKFQDLQANRKVSS